MFKIYSFQIETSSIIISVNSHIQLMISKITHHMLIDKMILLIIPKQIIKLKILLNIRIKKKVILI